MNKDMCTSTCIFIHRKLITGGKISFKSVLEKRKINIDVYRNNDVPLCPNSKRTHVILTSYTASDCKKIKLLIKTAFFFIFSIIVRGLMVGRKETCRGVEFKLFINNLLLV